jgi:hypothetical protein
LGKNKSITDVYYINLTGWWRGKEKSKDKGYAQSSKKHRLIYKR